jgi:hypothetical protein
VGLGWLTVALLAAGCGPRFGNVSGQVTYQGKPLPGGTITFYDAANGAASGPIETDGTYSVSKVATGRARVVVVPLMQITFLGPGDAGRQKSGGDQPPPLPAKYADPNKSGLTYDVTAGDQKHDFPLD